MRIRANLLVERDSQKKIVIGAGGAMIKRDRHRGRAASIERLLGTQVHLELWVKLEPGWAQQPKRLEIARATGDSESARRRFDARASARVALSAPRSAIAPGSASPGASDAPPKETHVARARRTS